MHFLYPAAVTVVAELAIFACVRRYRNVRFLSFTVLVNVLTNITLNLALVVLALRVGEFPIYSGWVLGAEALVVAWEFGMYGALFGFTRNLLGMTFLANAVTYSLGYLLPAF